WLGNPATLSPVLQTVQALTGSTGDTSPVPVAGFPAQTNTAAAMETTVQAMMPQTMTPQASPFNHAQLMAALLGLPAQQKTAPQMQTPGMSAQAQSSATADTQTGTIAANAPNTAGLQIQAAAAPNAAAAIHISATTLMPQSTAAPHGFGKELKGLDTSLAAFDATDGNMTGLTDPALQIHADAAQNIAGSTATLTAARTAASGLHPSIHLVSAALQRGMEGAVAGIDRQFTIQLEPANLGRVKITLQFSEDNTIKAKLVAERPETVAMLQKDANTLQRTLHDQGFNLNADSLTFDLGGQGSFQGSMSQNGNSYQNGGNASTDEDGTELATIETVMPIFVDPETGLTHVNVVI
ncbi:MAG: flagellar hook-length control protein FliK, partial [Alphaproteobacteria bacterium]|nr:flagellar hook-length control protein FliK [Alphaproteobacteria bacterium]